MMGGRALNKKSPAAQRILATLITIAQKKTKTLFKFKYSEKLERKRVGIGSNSNTLMETRMVMYVLHGKKAAADA